MGKVTCVVSLHSLEPSPPYVLKLSYLAAVSDGISLLDGLEVVGN